MKKMGFENPQVVFHRELTAGYTFFNCYGSCTHTVDYSNIHVPKVESTKWDMAERTASSASRSAARSW